LQFSDRQLQTTAEIMSAKEFNFDHKFPQNWRFLAPNFGKKF